MSNGSPPTELSIDTPISDLVAIIYDLSDDLLTNTPRLLLYQNRLQIDWQKSGLENSAAGSLIHIELSARPVAPATIKIRQLPAPVIESLNPDTAPAGADLLLEITGTGFDSDSAVQVGAAYGLKPTTVTETSLSVTVKASNIAEPGVLAVKVLNGDRQESNALDLTLT